MKVSKYVSSETNDRLGQADARRSDIAIVTKLNQVITELEPKTIQDTNKEIEDIYSIDDVTGSPQSPDEGMEQLTEYIKGLGEDEIEALKENLSGEILNKFNAATIKVESMKTEGADLVKEILEENNLPSDNLSQDIFGSIKNIVDGNVSDSASEIEKNNIIYDLYIEISKKDLTSTKNSSEIKELIRNELNNNGVLKDQGIIEESEGLGRAESYKDFLNKELDYYKFMEEKGLNLTDSSYYDKLLIAIEEINIKINVLEKEIEEYLQDIVITEEEVIPEEETVAETSTEEEPIKEEDEVEEEKDTEKITEEVLAEVITLNGTVGISGEEGSFPMFMTIDLKTGTVSGILYFKLYIDDIKFETDLPISGTMNLETRKITGKMGEGNINGILSTDGNRASGTGEEGMVWSASR